MSPDDGLPTATSYDQREVERVLSSLPNGPSYPPTLSRKTHLSFLARVLFQGFPKQYAAQEASQPWFMFWILQAFSVLGAALEGADRRRAIGTILACQHPDGGFGGGPKQAAHLLPTYAAVCALAIVGGRGEGWGWDQIDREGMHAFFLSLKQPDGSFRVARDAEVDIRGTYCLLATATLLDILTPSLTRGVPTAVRACQTYEGGFASASFAYDAHDPHLPRPPLGEAHGGYTCCALGSWVLLRPCVDEEDSEDGIDVRRLLRWLVKMQGSARELGGFRGRTNKLVDGCYAWWVGGCFALLEGIGVRAGDASSDAEQEKAEGEEEEWQDDDGDDNLFNKRALQEYVLRAAQVPSGGLRDKPPKPADAYHTLYNLAGLSAAQHHVYPCEDRRARVLSTWVNGGEDPLNLDELETASQRDKRRRRIYGEAQSWVEDEREGQTRVLGGQTNRINATHPLFNLTFTHARGVMEYFYGQPAIV